MNTGVQKSFQTQVLKFIFLKGRLVFGVLFVLTTGINV